MTLQVIVIALAVEVIAMNLVPQSVAPAHLPLMLVAEVLIHLNNAVVVPLIPEDASLLLPSDAEDQILDPPTATGVVMTLLRPAVVDPTLDPQLETRATSELVETLQWTAVPIRSDEMMIPGPLLLQDADPGPLFQPDVKSLVLRLQPDDADLHLVLYRLLLDADLAHHHLARIMITVNV